MKTKPENPPAFPNDEPDINSGHYEGRYEILAHYPGMSLRDWFAGMALHGIIAQPLDSACAFDPGLCAMSAFEYADAMLTARQTKP